MRNIQTYVCVCIYYLASVLCIVSLRICSGLHILYFYTKIHTYAYTYRCARPLTLDRVIQNKLHFWLLLLGALRGRLMWFVICLSVCVCVCAYWYVCLHASAIFYSFFACVTQKLFLILLGKIKIKKKIVSDVNSKAEIYFLWLCCWFGYLTVKATSYISSTSVRQLRMMTTL